jgi:hypothetical protein
MVEPSAESPHSLHAELPVFPNRDFDLVFDKVGWPLATLSDVSEEFLRKTLSGALTTFLGNKSIDNIYRTYFKDKSFDLHEGERLDFRVARFVEAQVSFFNSANSFVSDGETGPYGRNIAMWTLLRLKFSLRLIRTCAQRGGLFETASIARSALEQLAWAFQIRDLDVVDQIISASATKSITNLKPLFLMAGHYYGWLSDHTHWAYEAHSKVYSTNGKFSVHTLANSELKAKSLLLLLITVKLSYAVLKVVAEEARGNEAWMGLVRLHEQNETMAENLATEICELAKQTCPDDGDFYVLLSCLRSIGES